MISTYARIFIHSSRFFFFYEMTLDWQAKQNRTFCGKHELNSSTQQRVCATFRGSGGTYCFAFSFIKQKTIIIGRELQQSVSIHVVRGFARKSTLLTLDRSLYVHRELICDIDTLFSQLYIMYMVFALKRHKQVYNRNVYQKCVSLLQGTMEQDKLHFFSRVNRILYTYNDVSFIATYM